MPDGAPKTQIVFQVLVLSAVIKLGALQELYRASCTQAICVVTLRRGEL
jgi:hypothetical protein